MYELLASLSCKVKDGKLGVLCLISKTVNLRCKNGIPIKRLAELAMTVNRSTSVMPFTSICDPVVAICVSISPFATMISKIGGEPRLGFFGRNLLDLFQVAF